MGMKKMPMNPIASNRTAANIEAEKWAGVAAIAPEHGYVFVDENTVNSSHLSLKARS